MACTWDSTTMVLPAWIGPAWCACYPDTTGPQDVAHLQAWGKLIGAWDPTNPAWATSGQWAPSAPANTCPGGGNPGSVGCKVDTDCPTGQACQNGVCVPASSGTAANPFDFGAFFTALSSNPGQAFQQYPGAAAVSFLGAILAVKVALT